MSGAPPADAARGLAVSERRASGLAQPLSVSRFVQACSEVTILAFWGASTEPRHRGRGSACSPDREPPSHRFALSAGPAQSEVEGRQREGPRRHSPRGALSVFGIATSAPGIGRRLRLQRSPGIVAGDRRGGRRRARRRSGFNGAPASRPGIALHLRAVRGEAVASTEPRHRGRGSMRFTSREERSPALQRSPGIVAGDRPDPARS